MMLSGFRLRVLIAQSKRQPCCVLVKSTSQAASLALAPCSCPDQPHQHYPHTPTSHTNPTPRPLTNTTPILTSQDSELVLLEDDAISQVRARVRTPCDASGCQGVMCVCKYCVRYCVCMHCVVWRAHMLRLDVVHEC